MSCITDISKNITSDCSTIGVGGLETKAWIMNRTLINSITYSGTNPTKVTAMTMKSTKRAWVILGTKKQFNAGFEVVNSDELPKKWAHKFNFKSYEFSAAAVENIDALNDVVVICESKDKNSEGDGVFRIYGLEYGLYKENSETKKNDNSGARTIELKSLAGQEEKHSQYTFDAGTYAQTLAALVALETPAV